MSMRAVDLWAGVDVGGRRKGFHVAVVTRDSVASLTRCESPAEVISVLPRVRAVAIDSPRDLLHLAKPSGPVSAS
jgi:predicted nuclease with RNAse H fold